MSANRKRYLKIFYVRILSVIGVSALFILSYRLDIQLLEGSLTGSRFLGLHLADPFITLETLANHISITSNLLIGMASISFIYILLGGRVFCSWVCPYGLLSEIGEYLHLYLKRKGIVKQKLEIKIKGARYWFLALWLGLSFSTGYLVFEMINLMAITSRSMIYGVSFASILIVLVLAVEVFFARRFWCLYVCPIGTIYGLLNKISAGKIAWSGECGSCQKCVKECYDGSLLHFVDTEKTDPMKQVYVNGVGCTLCGRCIDACPNGCLKYRSRLRNIV